MYIFFFIANYSFDLSLGVAYTVFFCKQLLFLVEARVACVLGKYEAESCHGIA